MIHEWARSSCIRVSGGGAQGFVPALGSAAAILCRLLGWRRVAGKTTTTAVGEGEGDSDPSWPRRQEEEEKEEGGGRAWLRLLEELAAARPGEPALVIAFLCTWLEAQGLWEVWEGPCWLSASPMSECTAVSWVLRVTRQAGVGVCKSWGGVDHVCLGPPLFPWASKSDLDVRPLSQLLETSGSALLPGILIRSWAMHFLSELPTVSIKAPEFGVAAHESRPYLCAIWRPAPKSPLRLFLALQYLLSWLKRGQAWGKVRVAFISEWRALSSIFIQSPLPPGYYLSLELPSGLNPVKSSLPSLSVGNPFLHLRSPNTTLT
jgi:hypothetical protein